MCNTRSFSFQSCWGRNVAAGRWGSSAVLFVLLWSRRLFSQGAEVSSDTLLPFNHIDHDIILSFFFFSLCMLADDVTATVFFFRLTCRTEMLAEIWSFPSDTILFCVQLNLGQSQKRSYCPHQHVFFFVFVFFLHNKKRSRVHNGHVWSNSYYYALCW